MNGRPALNRRRFLGSAAAAALGAIPGETPASELPIARLPEAHREAVARRKRRIVMQHDVCWVMWNYAKMHPEGDAPFEPFRDAVFSYADEPGTQIDAIWWDIGGNAAGSVYPSKVAPVPPHPLVKRWHEGGIDWVAGLVNATRERKLEVFWNHRISEVDVIPGGGLDKTQMNPLKAAHPDWVVPASYWWQGMWNLASPGLREHKTAVLREIATRYDLDGIQIDFARHVPCLPRGRQWELREHVTEFMRMVRAMLLDVAQQRGRPMMLAARVPRSLEGCHVDGFDVTTWAREQLVDVLTLGSRSMDVAVEEYRDAVGPEVQLQPCFDDHHATDGYRYASSEFLRGVFANHWQRGANSVVTFNWAVGVPAVAKLVGGEIAPLTHQVAFKEIGDPMTLAGKDKFFAVERRGGYPWADGYCNRNDSAPLPTRVTGSGVTLTIHLSDAPVPSKTTLTLRLVVFGAGADDSCEVLMAGESLDVRERDASWKDAQIFSPKPQPASGGKGDYKVNPKQQLLRLDYDVPSGLWRQGPNEIEVRLLSGSATSVQLEKLEAHLRHA